MPLTIKPIAKSQDPEQVLLDLTNDAGDIVLLTCFSTDFRDRLLTLLSGALYRFTIYPKKGD